MLWVDGFSRNRTFIRMAKIDDLIKRIKALDGYQIKAGILKGATYPDTGQSVAQVAIWQEYGVPSLSLIHISEPTRH